MRPTSSLHPGIGRAKTSGRGRAKEGPWRDVRVYDVNDLVHWIEQSPAVGAWLARRLGKRPDETRELEDVWNEWSQATELPLSADLVLTDRDEDVAAVLRWLRGPPSVMSLRATTADEAVAFFHAALSELPDEFAQNYRARCLVLRAKMLHGGLETPRGPSYSF